MTEDMKKAWLEITQMLGETTREELNVFLRTWQRAVEAAKRQAVAEQVQPVAWTTGFYAGHCVIRAADPAAILPIGVALYTAPPPRQPWVGLTDEEVMDSWEEIRDGDWAPDFYAVIEAKLKEKNT